MSRFWHTFRRIVWFNATSIYSYWC